MCGIVGIYLKKKKLHDKLGNYLSPMLDNMSSRGPDSAGFAIYNKNNSLHVAISTQCVFQLILISICLKKILLINLKTLKLK